MCCSAVRNAGLLFSYIEDMGILTLTFQGEKLMRIMKEYCAKEKLDFKKTNFHFDGDLINGGMTLEDIDMEEGDIIDVQ